MNLMDIPAALLEYQTVLEPDQNVPEWWAGAPSVAVTDDGVFHLAARMREGASKRGLRGYEIRILRSEDGVHFEPVHRIRREDAGVKGFERPALRIDPRTGRYRLYGCTPLEQGWAILRFADADAPEAFDPATARPVLAVDHPDDGFARITGYKDPVVHWDGRQWRMFVIATDRVERIRQFVSDDGETWRPAAAAQILPNGGWHDFFTRPASVLPLPVGYLFVYEGSSVSWRDPVYNIATGLAYSPDLTTFIDLTPDTPLLRSDTPGEYHTWRYSDWVAFRGKVYVYFEAARPNNTNEIRVAVLPLG